jgi:hypothetical protein
MSGLEKIFFRQEAGKNQPDFFAGIRLVSEFVFLLLSSFVPRMVVFIGHSSGRHPVSAKCQRAIIARSQQS